MRHRPADAHCTPDRDTLTLRSQQPPRPLTDTDQAHIGQANQQRLHMRVEPISQLG